MNNQKKIAHANSFGEVLDLVNEQDEVIGTVDRQKANSDPNYIHREVGIILLSSDKKFLLQKRSKHKLVSPGVWSIVAGHVSSGKDPVLTADEELFEELGIDSIKLNFFEKKLLRYNKESHFMNYFVGLYEGQVINVDELEIEEYQFFSLQEVDLAVANGQKINTKHLPIIKKVLKEYEEM